MTLFPPRELTALITVLRRDEGHKPQHRESNEGGRVVTDRWADDGT